MQGDDGTDDQQGHPVVTLRLATPDECACYCIAGATWGVIAEDEGGIVAHLFVSEAMGQALGHDTRVWSEDKTVALRVWRFAREEVRRRGFERVLVHFEVGADSERLKRFWKVVGFEPKFEIYEGAV